MEAGRAEVEAAWPSVTKKPRQINDGDTKNEANEEKIVVVNLVVAMFLTKSLYRIMKFQYGF